MAQSNVEQELRDIAAAIGSVRFMDPPDGGNVSLAEQVTRMRQALERAEAALAQSDAEPNDHEHWLLMQSENCLETLGWDGSEDPPREEWARSLASEIEDMRAAHTPPDIRRILDRLRFCEDCLRSGVPDEYFGWAGDQPSLGELAQPDAEPLREVYDKIKGHAVTQSAPPRPDASAELIEAAAENGALEYELSLWANECAEKIGVLNGLCEETPPIIVRFLRDAFLAGINTAMLRVRTADRSGG